MFGSNTMAAPVDMEGVAEARRKLPHRRKGLFGKALAGAISGSDGVTMAHKGMPAVLQHNDAGSSHGAPAGNQAAPMGQGPDHGPLGGSMREPFDYDAALKSLQGDYKKPSTWQYVAAVVGDTLSRQAGYQPYAVQNLVGQQNAYQQRQLDAAEKIAGWQYEDWQRQNEADLRAANPFTIGRERLGYNPATGQTEVLYRGRQDAEIYADTMGFERGSEEWNAAAEDFVLRGSGPSAHRRDMEIDDHRTANDRSMEGYRQSNRLQMEDVRQRNRSAMEGERQDRVELRRTPTAARGSKPASVVTVSSREEAMKLPSGTRFRTPDGQVKVRP